MTTLSLFRALRERSTPPRVQRPPLTRLLEAIEDWQQIRAARVIRANAHLCAPPGETIELATVDERTMASVFESSSASQ
jgi:hypothetical protein